jgi:AraC-like DNA-binding protein
LNKVLKSGVLKKAKNIIPVYDLCTINPNRLHHDISAGAISYYYPIRDKLLIPHRHTFYHILLFTHGSGTVNIDFEEFSLLPGRIYFMIPCQVHSWDISGDKEGYGVNFSDNVFLSFISNPEYLNQFPFLRGIPNESVLDLQGEALAEAIYFFKQIIRETRKKDNFSIEQVCFHLMSLFISISRHEKISVQKQNPSISHKIVYAFRNLVNQHYKEKKLPKEYAAMLYITPQRLNTLCNDLLNMSAGEVIRERILLEAKRLLVNMNMNISEIAYELNFTDNSYFTKFFKKYTHLTPEEFRKHNAFTTDMHPYNAK